VASKLLLVSHLREAFQVLLSYIQLLATTRAAMPLYLSPKSSKQARV